MDASNSPESLPVTTVLGAWCATLATGKRIAVVGDAEPAFAEMLAEQSRRRVHVFDTDRQRVAARTAQSTSKVTYSVYDDDVDGSFDLVLIPQLESLRNPSDVIATAERWLSGSGVVVASAAGETAGDGIGYYDLYDLFAERFETVRMVGQAPFLAYSLADFAAEAEPEITIDTSLMSTTEEPERFIAVASNASVAVDPYTVIAVPAAVARTWMAHAASGDTAELAQARLEVSVLSAELEKLRERQERDTQAAKDRKAAATQLSARVAELEAALEQATAQLESKASDATGHVAELERRLGRAERDAHRAATQHERDIAELEDSHQEDVDRTFERIAELEAEAEALEAAHAQALVDAAQRARAEATAKAQEQAAVLAAAHAREIARLEAAAKAKETASHEAAAKAKEAAALESTARALEAATKAKEAAAHEAAAKVKETTRAKVPDADESTSPTVVRAFEFQIAELKKALAEARTEGYQARKALDAAQSNAAAEAPQRARPEQSDEQAEQAHAEEIDAYELRLKEQGARAKELQAQLTEAQRVGRELVAQLSPTDRVRPMPNGDASRQLEALSQRCSQHEANLQAAEWKIADLTQQLAQQDATASGAGDSSHELEEALRAAQREIAQLRRTST